MSFLSALAAAVPDVVTDPQILTGYRSDQMALAEAGEPLALVRARSVEDVSAVLRLATEHGVPVVTRGAGSGLAGGANAIDGCVVLSVAAMDEIVAIDADARTATVQCGVLGGTLAEALAARGLWYPPDPASKAFSTIGGNIATNAGGGCCLKYGVTGDHVAALTAVLPSGEVIRTGGRQRKNVAGLDLTRLLVGSEGTLAVIVEAVLRLRPAPRPPATLVAFFTTVQDAAEAVGAIQACGDPSLLELMDRTTIGAVERATRMGLDTDAGALLIVQTDEPDPDAALARYSDACAKATELASTTDPSEGEQFLVARRQALPALERLGPTLLDDVAVPRAALAPMIAAIEEIAARHGVTIGTFGHAGDGNLHPTIVFTPTTEPAARAAFEDIVRTALSLGGTITGEHGVGTLKTPYLTEMLGQTERSLMHRIKTAFDPTHTLNPGKAL
ncbi:FAD-binding oxidoreductase [Actinocorallia sp. A-T 12471]|uniref:FAD-binding oxidoreductase n=1 Tax=Actinocorallia sp. A-T 12471 TaxID=3089813 RepID=UPI0029D0565C|nr:FAD-linked oxidase C-terminal domain-containing protein [Actinocorallia sp. A-T 12471]MDX6741573.1 FAD-linked oxidase C-terminal domain-containing protein [Actinocorallia sp. A-T 12471]